MEGCWHGYLSGAWCRLAYGLADATATHFSCFSKIKIGFIFLVPADLGSPGKRAIQHLFVCVASVFVLGAGQVFILGCTNAGKSTLFNALLASDFCRIEARDILKRATASIWPGE